MPTPAYAAGAEDTLRRLSAPRWYDRLDALGTSPPEQQDNRYADLERAKPVIGAASQHLKQNYGLSPTLVGSLPLGLNVPGDVDVDLNMAIADKAKYLELVERMNHDAILKPSPMNQPNTAYNVYKAAPGVFGENPVDVTLSYGDRGRDFLAVQKRREEVAKVLDPAVAQAIIRRKALTRQTPFDVNKQRYRGLKKEINRALEGGTYTELYREKLSKVLDMSSPEDRSRLDKLLAAPDVYGHRTSHGETILESGRLMSGLQALSKGKLQGYESGFLPGLRGNLDVPKLTKQQLDTLSTAWLKDKPDYKAVDSLGHPRDALKGALIQQRLRDVNRHLDRMAPDEAESWRREHLRISKLSPHIFLTGQGLTADKGYGDVGFLFKDKRPTSSPFVTLIQNEAVLSPSKSLHMRDVNLRKALVVAPREKIDVLAAKHPGYDYVDEEALRERGKLLSTYDVAGASKRLMGHATDGTLRVLQG